MVYLANGVRLVFSIYIILIFIRILFAWLRPNMFNPIVRFVYRLTDPYLKLFAGLRFMRIGSLDFSPIFAFYVLYLLQELCYNLILRGHITLEFFFVLAISYFFRFVYFILCLPFLIEYSTFFMTIRCNRVRQSEGILIILSSRYHAISLNISSLSLISAGCCLNIREAG